MKKKNVFQIALICAIIVIGLIIFVPRNVELPSVDDLKIEIHSADLGIVELQDNEKNDFYKILNGSKYLWNPFVGNNEYYSSELVTVFITGSNVPYSLTLYCLPIGESIFQREPYAFVQTGTGSLSKYKFKDNQDLFDFLSKYCNAEEKSEEGNLQAYSYAGETHIEIEVL